jgi:hypothetical protein
VKPSNRSPEDCISDGALIRDLFSLLFSFTSRLISSRNSRISFTCGSKNRTGRLRIRAQDILNFKVRKVSTWDPLASVTHATRRVRVRPPRELIKSLVNLLSLKGTSLWFRSPPVRTSPAITLPSTYKDRLINPASCKT